MVKDVKDDEGNTPLNREKGAEDIVVKLKELADAWEKCPEVGMIYCDCVNDAKRFREMAARIMEIVGL